MMSALLIRVPYIDWILEGSKTWEIRGAQITKRGRIALADLVDVKGPLRSTDLVSNHRKLRQSKSSLEGRRPYTTTYARILKNARRLKTPVRYKHPSGCIIWVNLGPGVQAAITRQVGNAKASGAKTPKRRLSKRR